MNVMQPNIKRNIIEICKMVAESKGLKFAMGAAISGAAGATTAQLVFGRPYCTLGATIGALLYTVATQTGLMKEFSVSDIIDSYLPKEKVIELCWIILPHLKNLNFSDLNALKKSVLENDALKSVIFNEIKNFFIMQTIHMV